ncbi:guanylate kinase [Salibacteraceae bacterium]|jgi:guanylate kinase|nr:guanylate kinase [Salibacteraceae bacterium]
MTLLNAKGKAVIFSAPSGSGKSTIVRALLEKGLPLEFSISATSRAPRGQEVNETDYYFLGVEGFKKCIENDELLEWEEVYTNQFYGTLKSETERIWSNNKAVIFDVDVYGGLNLKQHFGDQALTVFVMPPSIEELENRLIGRNTENHEKIKMRLAKAKEELEQKNPFDVIVLNDDLDKAIENAYNAVKEFLNK